MNTLVAKKNSENWDKFLPKQVDAYSSKLGNKLSPWFYYPVKDEEGFRYRLNLLKGVSSNYIAISVWIVAGEFDLIVHMDPGGVDALLKEMIPEKFISNIPKSLFQAVFVKRFNKVFKYIESELGYEVNVVRFNVLGRKKRVKKGSFCWDIFHQGTMKGELWVSSKKANDTFLESFFSNINDDAYVPFMDQMPVVISVNLGCLQFSRKEILALEAGDVLILDKTVVRDKALLPGKLNIAPDFQSSVTIDEKQVVVKEELEKIVSKLPKKTKRKVNFEEVQLDITFEYGEKRISFSELKKIGPGYVITLDKDATESMDILANGRRIGLGEIVQVGSRTGIRVLKLYEGEDDGDS